MQPVFQPKSWFSDFAICTTNDKSLSLSLYTKSSSFLFLNPDPIYMLNSCSCGPCPQGDLPLRPPWPGIFGLRLENWFVSIPGRAYPGNRNHLSSEIQGPEGRISLCQRWKSWEVKQRALSQPSDEKCRRPPLPLARKTGGWMCDVPAWARAPSKAVTRISPEDVELWRKQDARASVHSRMGQAGILYSPFSRHSFSPSSSQWLHPAGSLRDAGASPLWDGAVCG